jgi:hypothetical protein
MGGIKIKKQQGSQMNQITAKVVNVDRIGDEYLITVRVGGEKHESAFEKLIFGEIKPHVGWYRYGWLDLVYRQNPGLKPGQPFPLWEDSEPRKKINPPLPLTSEQALEKLSEIGRISYPEAGLGSSSADLKAQQTRSGKFEHALVRQVISGT